MQISGKSLFWFSCLTQPKQVFFFNFSSFLNVYLLFKCRFVVDKWDFPENLHTVFV